MLVDQCPHCGAKHVQTKIKAECNDTRHNELWFFLQCQNPKCDRFFALFCNQQREPQFQYPVGKFSLPNDPKIPAEVPDEYRQAATCIAVGCYLASMTMSRRVLQRCLKQQGFEQKILAQQIDAAKADGTIPKRYHSLADEIREYGNIGAHPDDDKAHLATAEHAKHLLGFVDLLIHEFYELPAKASSMSELRTKGKPAK
jgi:Domain of unknown function (DUF4145)